MFDPSVFEDKDTSGRQFGRPLSRGKSNVVFLYRDTSGRPRCRPLSRGESIAMSTALIAGTVIALAGIYQISTWIAEAFA